jgi:hypothetical protein
MGLEVRARFLGVAAPASVESPGCGSIGTAINSSRAVVAFLARRLRRVVFLRRRDEELPPPLFAFCALFIGGFIIGGLIGELPSGRGASCAPAKLAPSNKLSKAPRQTLRAPCADLLKMSFMTLLLDSNPF